MLENFHLAAIVKRRAETRLRHIPLSQSLQNLLAETWQEQYDKFLNRGRGFFRSNRVDQIEFNPGYNPEAHECFRLSYELPDWLAPEDSTTVSELDTIREEKLLNSISGIVAFARDENDEELVLFQNFSRSHVIQPGRFLFLRKDTYQSTEHPGLTLGSKLVAVYQAVGKNLLFRNFRTVNSFLPLADFYKEASEREIREVLAHAHLASENPDVLATDTNQWFRKRFAMLKDSGVLDKFTVKQIQQRSKDYKGYDVAIRILKGKIVFPAEKSAAKRLLQFLNEELYRGPITENLYETNSKRKADQ